MKRFSIGDKVLFLGISAVVVFKYGSGKLKIKFANNTELDVEPKEIT